MSKITEKRTLRVPPQPILGNGDAKGRIVVNTSCLFVVGQIVTLQDANGLNKDYQVKRIVDKFMFLGDKAKKIEDRANLTAYQELNGATILAREQNRPITPEEQIPRIKYMNEPVMADRVITVDKLGNPVSLNDFEAEYPPGSHCGPGEIPKKSLATHESGPYGFVGIQSFIDKFTDGLAYNRVENSIADGIETLTFRQNEAIVKELEIRFECGTWMIGEPSVIDGRILWNAPDEFLVTENGEKIKFVI